MLCFTFLSCAAVYFGSQGLLATDADWNKSLTTNVVGFSNMVQACHPYMQNAGQNLLKVDLFD